MLRLERILLLDRVCGDPDDRDAGLGKGRMQAGEILGLARASRRIRLGVEIENELLSFETPGRYGAAAGPRRAGNRRLVARLQACPHMPLPSFPPFRTH